MYVQRYWSLLDLLSLDALRGSVLVQICVTDERAIRAYIQLCEDELEMRESGYIADTTYHVWAEAICEQLSLDSPRKWVSVRAR
jgi:hypothetical protein